MTACGGGPQGAVDKPFLLQDGRVGLRASLDKAWYTHGEDVCVTINIRNDSRKTVRKVRVSKVTFVGKGFSFHFIFLYLGVINNYFFMSWVNILVESFMWESEIRDTE